MNEPNHAYEYPYGKFQIVPWSLHWPPFGFRFTPRAWGLYAVYRWTLWLPGMEIRRWVGRSDVESRLAARSRV